MTQKLADYLLFKQSVNLIEKKRTFNWSRITKIDRYKI